jgi:hypothetical protein
MSFTAAARDHDKESCFFYLFSHLIVADAMANKTASPELMRKTVTAALWPAGLPTLADPTRWPAHLRPAKTDLASPRLGSVTFQLKLTRYIHFDTLVSPILQ